MLVFSFIAPLCELKIVLSIDKAKVLNVLLKVCIGQLVLDYLGMHYEVKRMCMHKHDTHGRTSGASGQNILKIVL